jgi:small membrane protein
MKLILLIFLAVVAAVYFIALRGSFISRLIVPLASLVSLVFIMDPESSNQVANWFGIGRGVDLLVLTVLPMLILALLVLLRKYLDLERTVTQLVRAIALERARNDNGKQSD